MTDQELEEYKVLRETICQRGTMRICAFVAGLATWGLATLAAAVIAIPLVTLVPLLILAATFEAVFSLHVGVERVGRYLQVFYEDRWEHAAMAFGRPAAAATTDPLFIGVFGLTATCNFIPVFLARPIPVEIGTLAGAHLLFGIRLAMARKAAQRQRSIDLERFQEIKVGKPQAVTGARAQS